MKKFLLSLVSLLMLCGAVFAGTYSYEFTAKVFEADGTKTLNEVDWTLNTGNCGYWGWDTNNGKGHQFGSGSKPATSFTLSTAGISGTITEIKVTTSGAKDIAATLDVTVGGAAFGEQYTLTMESSEVTFTGSASGDIVLSYAQTSSKAIYIKKIEVTTADDPVDPYDAALAAIQDGSVYRIKTVKNEKTYYLKADGYLTEDINVAGGFEFKQAAGGELYNVGFFVDGGSARFSNPPGTSEDNLKCGHISTSTGTRAVWEAQVFLLNDEGKYAVRATNVADGATSGWSWVAASYWAVETVNEVPVAQYSWDPDYAWELELICDAEGFAARKAAAETIKTWVPAIQQYKGFVQDASQFSYNSKANESTGAPGLIDNDYSTYFHTQWGASGVTEPHYLQAELPDAADKFYFYFVKRDPIANSNLNNRPTDIKISGSNDGEAFTEITEITEGLPSTVPPVFYLSDLITATEAYKYIRFTVIDTNNHAADDNGNKFFTFSEFYILPALPEIADALALVKADTPVYQIDVEQVNTTNAALKTYLNVVNVTYALYEGDKLVDSKTVVQSGNSDIDVPAAFTAQSNFYDYDIEGTIGTEDCTIKVTRSFKEGLVLALADLSNAKAYTITCDRGKLLTKDNYLASTAHSTLTNATPANFAILKYKENYFIYSVADKKFVTNSGALADAPTSSEDAILMDPKTVPYFQYYFKKGDANNGLNTNGNDPYGYVINNWMNADSGNQYYMIEAADFDATDALATLEDTFDPVVSLNAPTFNVAEGTQAAVSKLPAGSTLKINYSAKNIERCGYNADDLKVKVTVLLSGDLPENLMTMGSETAHTVRGASFYIPLGETEFPEALKPGYIYQNIVILAADLVKNAETENEEVIASYAGAPVQLHWVGIEGKVIYIETDMTSQFAALTNKDNWTTGAGGKAGYTGTNYCPAVTPNGLAEVQVCEFYEGNCDRTGDILYQTVTGLTEGTYTIELYGGAAYTFGRGFTSEAFSEGTWNAGDKITENTGVTLYATTSEGTFGGEIPIYYATNFPDGAAVVTLEGVKVGSNGEVKIGMSKTSKSTNWHVVQLKSVSAAVDANALLAASVEAAKAIDKATIPEALATKLDDTVAANNKVYDNADDYQAAINAINAVVADAKAYAPLTAALAKGDVYKAHSVDDAAKLVYDGAIEDVLTAYEAATVADMAAAIATVEAALPALAKTQTLAGADMTVFITNPNIDGSANGWTSEKPNGGNGPMFGTTAFEYWNGNASNGKFDYWQEIAGLPNGIYSVSADMYNSMNGVEGEFAASSGVYGKSGDSEAYKLVDVDGTELINYTTGNVIVLDGTLRIGVKNVETMAARWFVADNFKLTLVKPVDDNFDLAYEQALAAIGDGGDYYISTNVEETKYYITSAGKLTSNRADASVFTLSKVEANGYRQYGYYIDGGGTRFTNTNLSNSLAVLDVANYSTSTNNRKDWEAQVLFLEDGKYAIRATNAPYGETSWNDAGRVFFTWKVEDVAVPQYTYDQVYQWNLEAATSIVNVTYLLVESDGTTEVSSVVLKQEGNSEVSVPASLTSNFLYNYAVEGTIGTEDCTITITRTKKTTVNELAELSNAKAYVIACDRGALLAKEDHMYSTGLKDLADAQPTNFAVIYYDETEDETDNGSYYLYSASEKKFVLNDGSLAAMPTHGKFDALQMEAKDAPYFFCYFTVAEGTNYGLNTNGNAPYGYVINDWMNADPGNLYYMIEAADFDATEALAALYAYYNPSYYVTYVVKDAAGKELFKSEPAPTMLGTKITTLPAEYQRAFTTYNEVDVTIAEENTTVEFTATSAFPFELSTDFATAKWYNMTIRGEWWVGTEGKEDGEGIPVAEPYYPVKQTEDDAALLVKPAYQWAFSGDAYNGIIVWNKGAGAGFTLTSADEMAVMREGEYLWTIGQNSDGFTLRETGTEFNCINQNGGAGGPLSFWKSANSLGDNGSTFRISEAPAADPVEFTIKENKNKTGIGSGTQTELTKVKINAPFKLQATAKNKAANNLQDEDLTIHFDMIMVSAFKDATWTQTGFNAIVLQDVNVPYAQYFEVPITFSEEYPFIQSINFVGAKLMKGDEVIDEVDVEQPGAPALVVRYIEIVDENGNSFVNDGIKSIFNENAENVFDLSGRKVQKVQKGRAYIIDGKKAVIRKK